MYLIIILAVIFILISFFPIMELLVSNKESYKIEYEFPKELLNSNLDNLKFESVDNETVKRIAMQNRGSVRIAQGRVLSKKDLEEKKVKAFSVELP